MSLESRLVLHAFMCKQFGRADLGELLGDIRLPPGEGGIADTSRYVMALSARAPGAGRGASPRDIETYDKNIAEISRALRMDSHNRGWKPFQWLALLFVERYLDLYFANPEGLCAQLNDFKKWTMPIFRDMPDYKPADLSKLALQSATGSGKTLLLHANILQYRARMKRANQLHKLNKIVLLTPNEQMSRQHQRELKQSGFDAVLFADDGAMQYGGGKSAAVDIIDIHKLHEKKGVKRIAVDAFEDNNLVLVDEGHLGAGGTKWRELRRQLVRGGFCFEYSATFNQAVAKGDARALQDDYGKAMVYNYSYRRFYDDGYGKDYKIYNLDEEAGEETRRLYLLASLLVYYQQLALFEGNGNWRQEYQIARPLFVFLGRNVLGSSQEEEATRSDIVDIVKFFAFALNRANAAEVKEKIGILLNNAAGFVDEHGDPFDGAFFALKEKEKTPAKIYNGMMSAVFHGGGGLRVQLAGGGGELRLVAGEGAPFGVINVGDANGLYKLLQGRLDAMPQEQRDFVAEKNSFAKPIFDEVEREDSPINVAVGARKFVAGWSSWRVATMGLMRVGKREGPEIIQMFGRGVRLKGRGMTLKRHTSLSEETNNKLKLLETLNIIGLQAKYMEEFKKHLKGAAPTDFVSIDLPLNMNFGKEELRPLKIMRLRNNAEYARGDERPVLPPRYGKLMGEQDLRPQMQALASEGAEAGRGVAADGSEVFNEEHLALMDWRQIHRQVLLQVAANNWHNLIVPEETTRKLVESNNWYSLQIPKHKMAFDDWARVAEWEGIMARLIVDYAGKFWRAKRGKWENTQMKAVSLTEDMEQNGDIAKGYQVSIDRKEKDLIDQVKALKKELNKRRGKKSAGDSRLRYFENLEDDRLQAIFMDWHLYEPLLSRHRASDGVRVSPVPLNNGEKLMVEYLAEVVNNQLNDLPAEFYLMRNQVGGRGVSIFADCNFHPDFILWIRERAKGGDRWHVLFIDPKGLSRFDSKTGAKADLHFEIKKTQAKLQETDPNLFLHSYIWSVTVPQKIDGDGMPPEECHDRGIYLATRGHRDMEKMINHALANKK